VADPQTPGTDLRDALQALVERGQGASAEAVMLRLLALRQSHPDARVDTEPVRVDDGHVVIRASVVLPAGGTGSGIAAAQVGGTEAWAEVVERTETTAIARALDTLGYVLQVPAGKRPPAQPPAATPEPEPVPEETAAPVEPAATPEPPRERFAPRVAENAPPVVNALRRANRRPQEIQEGPPVPPGMATAAAPQEAAARPAAVAPPGGDDAHLEEYSWNAFWTRARSLGLTPDRVTELLGRPANQMTPRDAVAGLVEAGAWPTPDGA
jgi:hypothetical protein